jgi:hypothetical protein
LIAHDDMDALGLHELQAFAGASGAEHAIFEAEQVLDALHEIRFVVDYKETRFGRHALDLV